MPTSLDPEQARRFLQRRRRRLSASEYVAGILAGSRTVLAQAITVIESERLDDQDLANEILEGCMPAASAAHSLRVGITGVPGVGKSTFIEALGSHLTRDRGEKLAVLAVDPSSPLSGGSILGDKTRMTQLGSDPNAFIRPSPSRGSLGGVTRATRQAILLCEAAGFHNILVETVGVGQSETAVASMVDFFLLLMLASAGDELQGIKRGIIEMTDLIAINKADGDNLPASDMARRQYESALSLFPLSRSGWRPRVLTCTSLPADRGRSVGGVWDAILEHQRLTRSNGFHEQRRQEQSRRWMYEAIELALRDRFFTHPGVRSHLDELERQVTEGRISSFRAARQLLGYYQNNNGAEKRD